MPSINGVDFNNISSINGVNFGSVTNISGVPVSGGVSCTKQYYGYSDGKRNPPEQSCLETPYEYALGNNGVLYYAGGCGNSGAIAVAGYYSGNGKIYFWDGGSSFSVFRPCPR